MTILVTGGAGFIGANFVLDWAARSSEKVVVADKLTYAGNLASLAPLLGQEGFVFEQGDIVDEAFVSAVIARHQPRAVLNLAAESHVDRSIHDPAQCVQTNVVGTFILLEASRRYWASLNNTDKSAFRFLQVSTDEVYGSLAADDAASTELQRYEPNNPYSATKAASDHLLRAWFHTYGFPALKTNCCNNYGPYHFPEKLIPLTILNALSGKALPVYGDGQHVREWLYVNDHCNALRVVLDRGRVGESYNVGGGAAKTTLEVVTTICRLLDELKPLDSGRSYAAQIAFVSDRPGHDRRYAIDAQKIKTELGWTPAETFDSGIRKTVMWHLEHTQWLAEAASGTYRDWVSTQYGG